MLKIKIIFIFRTKERAAWSPRGWQHSVHEGRGRLYNRHPHTNWWRTSIVWPLKRSSNRIRYYYYWAVYTPTPPSACLPQMQLVGQKWSGESSSKWVFPKLRNYLFICHEISFAARIGAPHFKIVMLVYRYLFPVWVCTYVATRPRYPRPILVGISGMKAVFCSTWNIQFAIQ